MWRRGEVIPVGDLTRMLAKNPKARIMWVISKQTGVPLFGDAIGDWSIGRVMFANWCLFYDSVYESYKRPPDRIIEDDKKLDAWLKYEREQREMDAEKNYATIGGGKSAYEATEVYELDEGF